MTIFLCFFDESLVRTIIENDIYCQKINSLVSQTQTEHKRTRTIARKIFNYLPRFFQFHF